MRAVYRRWGGLLTGLGLTSASLSSGFIWACGATCVTDPVLWSPSNRPLLVFLASLCAWSGYLFAHWAWTGTVVDESSHDEGHTDTDTDTDTDAAGTVPIPRIVGVAVGVAILVTGMVIGVIYIRDGNHALTNVGGVFFLGGFVVAHYFETGAPL